MPSIGIVPEANSRQKGSRKPLNMRSLKSSRLPIDGHSAIGDIANTCCRDTPTVLCIGSWMIPF